MIAVAWQLAALGATLAIELPIAAGLARIPERRLVLLTALFANLASHSLASAGAWLPPTPWLALELCVTAFEALALRAAAGLPWPRAATLSLAMNLPTAALALALH